VPDSVRVSLLNDDQMPFRLYGILDPPRHPQVADDGSEGIEPVIVVVL
jgi:hypothetical protein